MIPSMILKIDIMILWISFLDGCVTSRQARQPNGQPKTASRHINQDIIFSHIIRTFFI